MNLMLSCSKAIDTQLRKIRSALTPGLFEKVEAFFNTVAGIATPVAAVVGTLIALVIAIKVDSLQIFLGGFVWIFALVICYYIGSKLQSACQSTLQNNPSSIAGQEYLDIVAVLNGVGAVVALLVGTYLSIQLSAMQPFFLGLALSLVLIYTVWLTLNPALITTYVQPSSSAGVDAIAILVLVSKIYLRANKVFFGLFPAIGCVLLLNSFLQSFGEPDAILTGSIAGLIGFIFVIMGLLAPMMCYLFFIFSYMLLDVVRSILAMGAYASAQSQPAVVQSLTPSNATEPDTSVSASGQPQQAVVQPLTPANETEPGKGVSAEMVKKIVIGLVILILGLIVIIKGKDFYADYQVKSKERRVEDERKKSEDERKKSEEQERQSREAAEAARVSAFADNARKYVNKPALDLILDPQINGQFRGIFRENTSDFEAYFAESQNVREVDGLLLGSGCRMDQCDQFRALAVVDLNNTRSYAVVLMRGNVRYFGASEETLPPAVKKWVVSHK